MRYEGSANMTASITLNEGQWIINDEYCISGNEDDAYTVRRVSEGEDSEILLANSSFEKCVVWCMNS